MPDEKWRPAKAPLVKKEFAAAKAGPRPNPVSKPELKKLEAQRSKPAPAPAPVKAKGNTLDRQGIAKRETRIKEIKGRLSAEKGKARDAFNKARKDR